MDKYDILEYSRVKATTVSVRLQIYLYAFKNTNNYLFMRSSLHFHLPLLLHKMDTPSLVHES